MNKQSSEIVIYQTEDGKAKVDVRFEGKDVWLNIEQMAELFQKSRSTINEHILNIFKEGELNELLAVRKIGNSDFSTKPTNYYNLDVIISVGYRVKSFQGTRFRQWATARLREYIQKGFAINDEFLKNMGGGIYWQELLERIRDIRSSEKIFYRQILDIYATSIDYNPNNEASQLFFKTVQNKMHYAVHKNTAAEIVYSRADGDKSFSGLLSWSGNFPKITDAIIAKNYLDKDELDKLNRLTTAFLEQAEFMALQHIPMYMNDWVETLDNMLKNMRTDLLKGSGKISHDVAEKKAKIEFTKYTKRAKDVLTQVEKDYLDSITKMQSIAKGIKHKKQQLKG
jgi:hypothetical protein